MFKGGVDFWFLFFKKLLLGYVWFVVKVVVYICDGVVLWLFDYVLFGGKCGWVYMMIGIMRCNFVVVVCDGMFL